MRATSAVRAIHTCPLNAPPTPSRPQLDPAACTTVMAAAAAAVHVVVAVHNVTAATDDARKQEDLLRWWADFIADLLRGLQQQPLGGPSTTMVTLWVGGDSPGAKEYLDGRFAAALLDGSSHQNNVSTGIRVRPLDARTNLTTAYAMGLDTSFDSGTATTTVLLNDRVRTHDLPVEEVCRWVCEDNSEANMPPVVSGRRPDTYTEFGINCAHWDFRMRPFDSGCSCLGEFARERLNFALPCKWSPNGIRWCPNFWMCLSHRAMDDAKMQALRALPTTSLEVDHFMERLWFAWCSEV